MVIRRSCKALNEEGAPCGAAPLLDDDLCYWHNPATAQEAAEARRMGGVNKKRERTLAAVYEFEGLDTVPRVRRLFEIAGFEALALPQGPNRCRILVQVGLAALKALDIGEHEELLLRLDTVLGPRLLEDKRR